MIAPEVVAHADWGTKPSKRQVAVARLRDSSAGGRAGYDVVSLTPAPDRVLSRLASLAGVGQALIGLDFPIGLPGAFAERAQIRSFPGFLRDEFGRHPFDQFANVARLPEEISLRRPFYPYRPGSAKREHLSGGLSLEPAQLRRRCERDDAETVFWTLGGKQVGKGALAGWALIAEEQRDPQASIALWPFEGELASLLDGRRRMIIAETYPRAYYEFIRRGRGRWSKRRQGDRLLWVPGLLEWAGSLGVGFDASVLGRVQGGFSAGAAGEDEFDAVVGLIAMIAVISEMIPSGEPDDPEVRSVEGWILGRPCYRNVSLPDWFALESRRPDGSWADEAFCTRDLFARQRDGSYLNSDGGSGLWIRAEQVASNGEITHVDGGGTRFRYRLVPLPSPRYPNIPSPSE